MKRRKMTVEEHEMMGVSVPFRLRPIYQTMVRKVDDTEPLSVRYAHTLKEIKEAFEMKNSLFKRSKRRRSGEGEVEKAGTEMQRAAAVSEQQANLRTLKQNKDLRQKNNSQTLAARTNNIRDDVPQSRQRLGRMEDKPPRPQRNPVILRRSRRNLVDSSIDGLSCNYPPGQKNAVHVTSDDVRRLQDPDESLNDTIIDFQMRWLWEELDEQKKERFHFFDSLFFRTYLNPLDKARSRKAKFQSVSKWTKSVDIFSKEFVVIPVCRESHWSLFIICNLRSENPFILHFDSLATGHNTENIRNHIGFYLEDEWRSKAETVSDSVPAQQGGERKFQGLYKGCTRKRTSVSNSRSGLLLCKRVEVPRQRNHCDCGLFLLTYLERFTANIPPEKLIYDDLSEHYQYPRRFMGKDWFAPKQASNLRVNLLREILKIIVDCTDSNDGRYPEILKALDVCTETHKLNMLEEQAAELKRQKKFDRVTANGNRKSIDFVDLSNDLKMQILKFTDLVTVARFACVCRSSREVSRALLMCDIEDCLTLLLRTNFNHRKHFCKALVWLVRKPKSGVEERLPDSGDREKKSKMRKNDDGRQPFDNDSLREAVSVWSCDRKRAEDKHGSIYDWQDLDMDSLREAVSMWSHDRELAEAKYGHISTWDTSRVTDMYELFKSAPEFDEDISHWDTSNVTNMSHMFYSLECDVTTGYDGCTSFNQPIGKWNTSNVTNMSHMFDGCGSFNQPIGEWNTSNVRDMSFMFLDAPSFNQLLRKWDTSNVRSMEGMFDGASSFKIKRPGGSGGCKPEPFDNDSLREAVSMWFRDCTRASIKYGYISTWDTSRVTNMKKLFEGTEFNEDISQWDTSNVTTMEQMFHRASSFNQPIGKWNISNVTNIAGLFSYASSFNQPIREWNTSKVTDMGNMFYEARSFNQPLGKWDTANVRNMSHMFYEARSFNDCGWASLIQSIGKWNTANVRNMSHMFYKARSFNQSIGKWDTSNVIDMSKMFCGAKAFCANIEKWNTSQVRSMNDMFGWEGRNSTRLLDPKTIQIYDCWESPVPRTPSFYCFYEPYEEVDDYYSSSMSHLY